MTHSPELSLYLKNPDEIIQQIKNSRKENNGDKYAITTQEITVRTLLTLIDKLHIPINPNAKQKLQDEFEI